MNLLIQKRLHVFAPMILLAVVLAVVLAAFISGAMRRSLGQMVDVVSAISCGRLQRRLRRLPGTEFAPLAEAVNRMADSIGEQVRIASDKTAQLESVLNTMSDGVLVLGPQGRIRRCNGAFARLFPQVTDMAGSPVIEVIPSPELQDAVDAAKALPSESEKAVAFHDNVLPAMDALRAAADDAETICGEDYWPLPSYSKMLYYV